MKRRVINYWCRLTRNGLDKFRRRFAGGIRVATGLLSVVTVVAAIACLTCFTVYIGYEHDAGDYNTLRLILRIVQGVFVANILFNLVFNFRHTIKDSRVIKWVVDIGVLLSVLPWLYPHPAHPWIPLLERVLYSNYFLYPVMVAYSVVEVSYGVTRLTGRRTNPSLMLSGSFLLFIGIGSLLLMLPKCTYGGISYIDSLFVSTSAVCITGLTPVDVSVTFTPLGLLVIACLVQIGALGVLTFTSFFSMFFSGSGSIYNQLMMRDLVYSRTMTSLIPTILYIFVLTVTVEAIGAVMLFFSVKDVLPMTTEELVMFSAFHSVSAFCNAGFSSLPGGMSNPLLLYGDQSVYWVMSLVIVSGSIGFPLLVNIRDAISRRFRWFRERVIRRDGRVIPRPVHLFSMNTKIVVVAFGVLFLLGAVSFFFLEQDNSLRGFDFWEKVSQSVFNSVTPRSAGFSSVNPAGFLNVTLVVVMFLMWVGGASQSTGGGIKVNTLAAIILNLRSIITGRNTVTAFRRTIAIGSIRRANAVVALSIFSFFFYSVALMLLEPGLSPRDLLFESCSALFTVGSSLGVTSELSQPSLILLCTAMFLGRVGILSMLSGVVGHRYDTPRYPSDTIVIN